MDKEISSVVVIDRDDYDELVEKANTVDAEIQKRAERAFMRENEIPVRIEFNQHRNSKNFAASIGFIRCWDTVQLWDSLDKIEPQIRDWMNESMSMFDMELKEKHITAKDCIGLRKRVTNLDEYIKRLKIRYTFLFSYAIVISVIVFLLLTYLK